MTYELWIETAKWFFISSILNTIITLKNIQEKTLYFVPLSVFTIRVGVGVGEGGGILLSNSTNFKKRQILKQDKSTLKSKNGCPNHF